MHRRSTALLAAMAAFALVAASAATLGDLDVGGLGASAEEVVACTSDGIDVDLATGAYDATAGLFPVGAITLDESDGLDSCAGKEVTVVLLDADPTDSTATILTEVTGNFDAFNAAGVTPTDVVDAEDVLGIAVSIVG